jgi:hypothetical protein
MISTTDGIFDKCYVVPILNGWHEPDAAKVYQRRLEEPRAQIPSYRLVEWIRTRDSKC